MKIFLILGLILGLVVASIVGTAYNNYEVSKCHFISQNQYYEAQTDCYTVLQTPTYNLIRDIVAFYILFGCFFGFVGFIIDEERELI